ncbi:elongation factor G [Thomasclavelia saccharogumia]|uniref:elongation factor G n=1 Tax=Thomasclavelia saccharogumia TaxID=341225 RepID=UPI00047A5DDE|nr:elongation factor G [Thomasclavelia saccharogumia]
MRTYHANEIGNVAVLGHSGCGKTSIVEAMAYRSGLINRIGTINDGNTLSDYSIEEINRKSSVNLSVVPIEWNNCKINLIDVPGIFDFTGECESALSVCESALIVVPSSSGINAGTKQAMYKAKDKAKIIYVNGLDNPNSDYATKLQQLKDTYGKAIAPIQVPIMDNNKMIGYVNVAKMEGRIFEGTQTKPMDIPEELLDEIQPIKDMIDEAVANTSDELLEKYINEEPFTKEEISLALRKGVIEKTLIPVLCGTDQIGIQIILNSMVAFFSAAGDMTNSLIVNNIDKNEEEIIGYDESLPASIFIFKTVADPFVGRTSLFKVVTGTIYSGTSLYNVKRKEVERIAKLYQPCGKELIEVDCLHAGDIGVVTKLNASKTNDTLCIAGYQIIVPEIKFSTPYYGKAIVPIGKSNEEKITNAINKLLEEDPTLQFKSNPETKQQCIYGIGDIHLDILLTKLKNKFKVETTLEDIKIPYRETIKKSITQRTRFKKQSGGHGQFGEVEITFEPTYDYSKAYIFEEKIFGGAVPKSYFPAVEKGLIESVKSGVLAGYPVLGIKATLIDGSYHNVDSSEMAFKTATSMCFKEAIPKASPALLEPYMKMKVVVDEQYTGDIMSNFNTKRARVIGSDVLDDGLIKIVAEAPMNEVMNYAVDLRSITQGQGIFEMEFLDYEFAPDNITKRIINK